MLYALLGFELGKILKASPTVPSTNPLVSPHSDSFRSSDRSESVLIMAHFQLFANCVGCPEFGPDPKRPKGRNVVARLKQQLSGVGAVRLATLVLENTGFLDRPGGGEPGIPVLIGAFLQGWPPILRELVASDALPTKTLATMARFACTPTRLVYGKHHWIDRFQIKRSGTYCTDQCCPFRVKGHSKKRKRDGPGPCCVTKAEYLPPAYFRQLLLAVPARKWEAHIPGDDLCFAHRITKDYLEPLERRFKATDESRATRLRIGLPPATAWVGVSIPTLGVVRSIKVNKRGRVNALLLDSGGACVAWCRLVGLREGWHIQLPRCYPRRINGLVTPVPIPKFHAVTFVYS